MSEPSIADLLAGLPRDPPAGWPSVPERPVPPGRGWDLRRTEGTGHPVWVPAGPADDLAGAWLEHRRGFGRTGLWPLLVTSGFWEAVELGEVERGVGPGRDGSTRDLLAHLVGAYQGEDAYEVERGPLPTVGEDHRPASEVVTAIAAALPGPDGGAADLVLVPARAPWLVLELLGWDGAVNVDVLGVEHTAVLGRWSGLFGAEPVGLTRDVLTLLVTRPPTTTAARLSAAAEVYAYCPDAVEQGTETLEALTEMTAAQEWFLWWD